MSKRDPEPDGAENSDEEELIRSEFDSIVAKLSLDESAPTTYLDDLDRIDRESFIPPRPPRQSAKGFFTSARAAFRRWFNRGYHEDDGAAL